MDVHSYDIEIPPMQVISAFEVPKVLYDPVRKCFYISDAAPKLLAGAEVHFFGIFSFYVYY